MNDIKRGVFDCIGEIMYMIFLKNMIECRVVKMLLKCIDFVYLMFIINLESRLFDI